MRFIFLSIDGTHGAALREAAALLGRDQGVDLGVSLYTATSLRSAADWQRLESDVAGADFVFGARLFGEELVRPLERLLLAAACPVCVITSNPALINCTRLGKFVLRKSDEPQEPGLLMQLAQKFRPRGGSGEGKRQLAIVRNLSKVLKFIPGKARDLHTYISAHQYWADSSPENLRRLLALLVERYVPGFEGRLKAQEPLAYPPAALFHPDAPAPFPDLKSYEEWRRQRGKEPRSQGAKEPRSQGTALSPSPHLPLSPSPMLDRGVVGLLALRSTALTGNTAHLDALVRALEARGIEVRLAYCSGLDMRPAIEQFFTTSAATQPSALGARRSVLSPQSSALSPQSSSIDLLINGTGFSLVGGPAESRPDDARVALEALDVAFLDMIPLSFQRVEEWRADDTGLAPIQLALNVALPELDGAAEPLVIGGPTAGSETFVALPDQIDVAARRVAKRVALRRKANGDKKLAVVLFNFPPTLGNVGTAAYLDVFASLHRLLLALRDDGYTVDVPASVDDLRAAVVEGNALLHGTDGNVAAHLPMADYTRLFPHYREIEPFWGRAPGELLNDGKRFQILGLQLGNVFVGIQPSFGYERDPMRLLMAKDAAPNHGFAAFYTWLEHVFGADAVVHFGTHGALEFMPGKQAGLSADCWPTRLIGGLPNLYYYSVNNPSEATIAKRRGAATTVSYLVPPLQQAGLYKGLRLLKDSIDSYRKSPSADLLEDIHTQAAQLSITPDDEHASGEAYVAALAHELLLIEQRMIPLGLHVLGKPPAPAELVDFLALASAFSQPDPQLRPLPQLVAAGLGCDYEQLRAQLRHDRAAQERWEQVDAIVREAMRLFVEGASAEAHGALPQPTHGGQRDSQRSALSPQSSVLSPDPSADAYLARAANIKPGTLTKLWAAFARLLGNIVASREIEGLLHGLRGGFIPPSPSNDVVRNHDVVPTGRNVHGLDPYRAPSAAAQAAGELLMGELLERLTREQGALPETVAVVLWGTDNLKSECEGVSQVLALLGARPVPDELGNISSVALVPLAELGRPRIDVLATVSGIFRDLLHHQMDLIDQAVHLAAAADEPAEWNFVRKHALAQAAELHVTLDEAATRVFANAPGSYGGNINNLVESSTWENDGQLSEAFLARKSFAYSRNGAWREARAIMERSLATVDATFQNIDSFEVGVSDIDYYYESLGGVTKSVETLRGERPPVVVADALVTNGGRLASLEQMVRLESRAKLLNPKWFEAMLAHGYEGVREVEARVNNTYGWSATAGAVDGWVYQGVADTFLLDEAMRERMAGLNPHATAAVARRLLEAADRGFWQADDATLAALQDVYGELEDRLEGVTTER